MQRLFDILFSFLALVLLCPVLLPLMAILRVTGEREVFFRQSRIGLMGNNFMVYKFATMLKDSPTMGSGTVTLRRDPRILPLGHFLRSSKINELPQLLNILKGDMSLIGPRPQTERCFFAFPEIARQKIVMVRPGLSSIASIVFRNEEEMMDANASPDIFYDTVIMPYKGELEIWYVDNKSLYYYFLLIFLTIFVIFYRSSSIIYRFFPALAPAPNALKAFIHRQRS